jgi:hypothetical protein
MSNEASNDEAHQHHAGSSPERRNAKPRRDRHGRYDCAAPTANTSGPRANTRPAKTVGRRRTAASSSISIELPEHDPAMTPAVARALLRLILKARKKQQLDLPDQSTLEQT